MAVIDYVERMEKTVRELVKQPWSKVVEPTPTLKAGTSYDSRRELYLGKPGSVIEINPTQNFSIPMQLSKAKERCLVDTKQRYTVLDYAREIEIRRHKMEQERQMLFGSFANNPFDNDPEVVAYEALDEIFQLPIDEQITTMRHTLENL